MVATIPPDPIPLGPLGPVSVLVYATCDLAPAYRAVMQAFFDAKQTYVVELDPAEVLSRVKAQRLTLEPDFDARLEERLASLVRWGNLAHRHDTAAVARLEDFYRRRYVYRLTPSGEAAHEAVQQVERAVGRSGSLQTSMLRHIAALLVDLNREYERESPRPETLLERFHSLFAAFATLTQEASTFMSDLIRQNDDDSPEPERFMLQKQALVNYLTRFIEGLTREHDRIEAGIRSLVGAPIQGLLQAASTSPDLPPAASTTDPATQWCNAQAERWAGVVVWFLGGPARAPTVQRLRNLAVETVVQLARGLNRLNDHYGRGLDRRADFLRLAELFAACNSNEEAHGLWRAAFGLQSARHFHLEEEDSELVSPRTSWWDAQAVAVPLPVRTNNRSGSRGTASAVPNHHRNKRYIAEQQRRARADEAAALSLFVDRGEVRLGTLQDLTRAQLDALARLLDEALAAPRDQRGDRACTSSDGRYVIILRTPNIASSERVSLRTAAGRLRCADYRLHVQARARAETQVRKTP